MTPQQLSRYCRCIGLPEIPSYPVTTAEAVGNIMLHHVTHIPFENLSVLWGEPVRLDVDSLLAKFCGTCVERGEDDVRKKRRYAQRGGCCFEQNLLLLSALRTLGVDVVPIKGWMRLHLRDRSEQSDRAHLLLVMKLQHKRYLLDAALGSLSMTCPVSISEDALDKEQHTQDGPRRVSRICISPAHPHFCTPLADDHCDKSRHNGPRHVRSCVNKRRDWMVFEARRENGSYRDVYTFNPDALFAFEDMVKENAVASSPESDLATRLIVSKVRLGNSCVDGHERQQYRITLRNMELFVKNIKGELVQQHKVSDEDNGSDLRNILETHFGINISSQRALRLREAVSSHL